MKHCKTKVKQKLKSLERNHSYNFVLGAMFVELTFGAISKQFLKQSFMQSAAARAGAGDDMTAAAPKVTPTMEANESRRDRSTK